MSFSDLRFEGGAPLPSLADGYYYQLDVTDPRTATGWVATSKLHDGITGDVSTFEQTAQGGEERFFACLVVKASGMTFDELLLSPGFSFGLAGFLNPFGSNDLAVWTSFNLSPPLLPTHSGMSYESAKSWKTTGTAGPFRYIGFVLRDITTTGAQVGCADVRVRNATVDVGPS